MFIYNRNFLQKITRHIYVSVLSSRKLKKKQEKFSLIREKWIFICFHLSIQLYK